MPATTTRRTSKDRGQVEGYRSGLEERNVAHLHAHGIEDNYEAFTLRYSVPARFARYTPDLPLPHNGIIVETKGRFVTADRQKHILIKNEYPELDVRFVFSNPNARISKTSKTTYAAWCERHGFTYAKTLIPVAWLQEPAEPLRVAAMRAALGITNAS